MGRRLDKLPDWIRFAHKELWFPRAAYLNAFERLSPTETRLYGTESMYGDWDASILLVLQDWCNDALLEKRIRETHPDPWSHEPGMATNRFLRAGFGPEGSDGLLYASALANLLKKTPETNGEPPCFGEVLPYLARVMDFAFDNLPNLRAIVCFGRYAEDVLLSSRCRLEAHFDTVRNTTTPISGSRTDGRPLSIFAAKHPSRGWSYESIRAFANAVRSCG